MFSVCCYVDRPFAKTHEQPVQREASSSLGEHGFESSMIRASSGLRVGSQHPVPNTSRAKHPVCVEHGRTLLRDAKVSTRRGRHITWALQKRQQGSEEHGRPLECRVIWSKGERCLLVATSFHVRYSCCLVLPSSSRVGFVICKFEL